MIIDHLMVKLLISTVLLGEVES